MVGKFATETEVPVHRSRQEIEETLRRYGASSFQYGWEGNRKAVVAFRHSGRFVRFMLLLPDKNERRFVETPSGQVRSSENRDKAWEQGCRSAWRALALVVKAKLEAVAAGISEFEDEFLAHIVLPDGSNVGQWLRPQLERTYREGSMPDGIFGLLPPPE